MLDVSNNVVSLHYQTKTIIMEGIFGIIEETEYGVIVNPVGIAKCSDCMFKGSCNREIERSHKYGHRYMNFNELKEYFTNKQN